MVFHQSFLGWKLLKNKEPFSIAKAKAHMES